MFSFLLDLAWRRPRYRLAGVAWRVDYRGARRELLRNKGVWQMGDPRLAARSRNACYGFIPFSYGALQAFAWMAIFDKSSKAFSLS
jgi:hypothetical protein